MAQISKEKFRKILGKHLNLERKKWDYSQTEFAEKLGLDRTNLNKYEKGTVLVPVDILFKMIQELETDFKAFHFEIMNSDIYEDGFEDSLKITKDIYERKIEDLQKSIREIDQQLANLEKEKNNAANDN